GEGLLLCGIRRDFGTSPDHPDARGGERPQGLHSRRGTAHAGSEALCGRRLRTQTPRCRTQACIRGGFRAMTRIVLMVNSRPVEAEVAPRTQLADFLREQLLLTGTHIGCEHGVCGACTVEIDGEIARSCITYAVACDGARIRTIEGFDEDALMGRLRQAF